MSHVNGNGHVNSFSSDRFLQVHQNGFPSDGLLQEHQNGFTENGKNQKRQLPINNMYTYEVIEQMAQSILAKTKLRPKICITCGTGIGSLGDSLQQKESFPYDSIPNFPVSTVPGHSGQLVFGYLGDVQVVCMQGRFHNYEGYPLWKCSMPVRVMKMMGVTHLIITNAAGGINPEFKVGDIMVIKDHINFMGFAGNNPLQGFNDERFGPRFPAMNRAYDLGLRKEARRIAKQQGISDMMHEGVYTCVGGPNYETIAEIRMMRMLGIDAVGMSTVHEVIMARHCDLKVFAFSLITNVAITDYDCEDEANHAEVVDTGKLQAKTLKKFVTAIVEAMDQDISSNY